MLMLEGQQCACQDDLARRFGLISCQTLPPCTHPIIQLDTFVNIVAGLSIVPSELKQCPAMCRCLGWLLVALLAATCTPIARGKHREAQWHHTAAPRFWSVSLLCTERIPRRGWPLLVAGVSSQEVRSD